MAENTVDVGDIPSPSDMPDMGWGVPTVKVTPPPPPVVVDQSFMDQEHTWYGTDGSVWPLTAPMTGLFLVQEAVEGMHNPPFDTVVRESPSIPGGSFHGHRIKPRPVSWIIYIYSDESSEHFYDLDRRFWDSMKIGRYGVWRVTLPDGTFRELRMRLEPMSITYDRDPGKFGWKRYGVEFVADTDPLWRVPKEVAGSKISFEDESDSEFFGPGGTGGPPFNLSPERVELDREVVNSGDEDAYYTITITGPMDTVDIYLGDREYTVTCNLGVGEKLVIDTDPRRFMIYDSDGNDRIDDISSWIFDPIPSKESVPLTVVPVGQGGGSVVVDLELLYHRAW